MPPTPPPTPEPGEPRIRDRGDACPGALRLHSADDGRLARLRLPAGRLTPRQAEVLAEAAETLGDGRISVTSRGNAELRGLPEGCGTELAALLAGADLLPSPTHERVRNIVASPAAGLDGLGHGAVQLWARELDALLCAAPWAAALSGRFLFALDDGRGDVAGLGGDVTLIAVGRGIADAGETEGDAGALLRVGDQTLRIAGAGQTEEDAGALLRVGDQTLRIAGADAARAALAAAGAFLTAARESGTGAWRVRELPADHPLDLPGALTRAGIPAEPVRAGADPVGPGAAPDAEPVRPREAPRKAPAPVLAPGVLGTRALHVLAPLGRLTAPQLRALAEGAEEVRLTPWRGAVVVGVPADRLAALEAYGLITRPGSPWVGVSACTGRPGCAKSLADVRADATPAPLPVPGSAGTLPVHYSGCERRCGHPHGTWIDVLATGDGTYLVDGRPTPRTSLPEAVATARTHPTTR